jgi:chaperonin cofactor prefoldin
MDDNEIMAKSNTTTPTTLYLQTDGGAINIGATNFDVTTAGALTIASSTAVKATGSSWTNPSDVRLKQNINTYSSGLDDILKIRPVTFNYISRPKEEVIGVIAQELQQIAPYMVSESKRLAPDGTPYLQVDNSAMTYMLINAVKELAKQTEELKKQNEELKTKSIVSDAKYDTLKAEIESMKLLIISQNIVNNIKQ